MSADRKFDTSYGDSPAERVTVRLSERLLETLDAQVRRGEFPNRSAAIRDQLAAQVFDDEGGDDQCR